MNVTFYTNSVQTHYGTMDKTVKANQCENYLFIMKIVQSTQIQLNKNIKISEKYKRQTKLTFTTILRYKIYLLLTE